MAEAPPPLIDIARVATAVSRALEPGGEQLVESIARTARSVFQAAACSIALLSDDGTELVFTTTLGGADAGMTGLRIPAEQGIAGWVATTGQPLAVADLGNDPRFAANVASNTGYFPRAILACPIATEDRLLGVVEILDRDEERAGSEADLELLSLFAHQAALALDAAERSRRLGSVLLEAYASVTDDVDVADALADAAAHAPADDEFTDVAAAFARLARLGPSEWRLAVDLLDAVGRHTARVRP